MPIQTRSKRQSTIDFPTRKAQTPGRSLHSCAKDRGENLRKIVNEGKKVHSRSRSLSPLSQDKQSPPKPEVPKQVARLAERLDFNLSPKKNKNDESPNKKEGILSPVIKSPRIRSIPIQGKVDSPNNKDAISPLKSPRKRTRAVPLNDENRQPPACSPAKTNRGCGNDNDCIDAEKLTPEKTLLACAIDSPLRKLCISRQDDGCYSMAKEALHTSQPERLLCRERELGTIRAFLRDHLAARKPGSLYISGPPGTGKTACIHQILQQDKSLTKGAQHVFINCMMVGQSQGIYSKVLQEVAPDDAAAGKMSAKAAAKALQKTFTSRGPAVLLVLDEIDNLDSKNQEVLYTMFEWPSLPKSRLVLIGVANALDLTDRVLPRLQSRPRCKPQLLHFAPYTKDQLATILQDRLEETTVDGVPVVEPNAVQFCARKVAAVAGDARKALDICRRAVELVQTDVRTQSVLTPKTGSPRKLPGSPQKSRSPRKQLQFAKKQPFPPKKVGLGQVSRVINEVYGSGAMSSSSSSGGGDGGQSFPLQQKLAVCTLLLMVKEGKSREVTLGKVHDTYRKICTSRQVVPVDQSEFLSLCQLVETRGVLAVKKSKDARQSKMSLKMNESEVEFALQDKVLLSAILQAGLPGNGKNKKS